MAKTAAVSTNDPDRRSFNLRLSVKIYDSARPDSLKPVALSASRLNWTPGDRAKVQRLTVRNVSDSPVKMKTVSLPYGFVEVDAPKDEIKPGKSKEIKIKVAEAFTGTEFQKSFTVELNDSAKTRFTVPVVYSAVVATPAAAPNPGKKVPYVDTTKTGASLPKGGK